MTDFRNKMINYGRTKYPTFDPSDMTDKELNDRLETCGEFIEVGLWRQGAASHETISDKTDRLVAEFQHASTAAFVDMLVNAWKSGRITVSHTEHLTDDNRKLPGVIWAEPDNSRGGGFITCLDKCEHGHTEPYFSADMVQEMIDKAFSDAMEYM